MSIVMTYLLGRKNSNFKSKVSISFIYSFESVEQVSSNCS